MTPLRLYKSYPPARINYTSKLRQQCNYSTKLSQSCVTITMNQTVKQVHSGSTQGKKQISIHNNTAHQKGSAVSYHGGHYQAKHGGHVRAPSVHGGHYQAQHGGHIRAPSVHGGSGGKGISISRHFSHGHSFGSVHGYSHGNHFTHQSAHGVFKNDSLLCFNEKETMQLLNNRMATYMEKVCSLEQKNGNLERNIREWFEKNEPDGLPDCSKYYRTIQELQNQVTYWQLAIIKVFTFTIILFYFSIGWGRIRTSVKIFCLSGELSVLGRDCISRTESEGKSLEWESYSNNTWKGGLIIRCAIQIKKNKRLGYTYTLNIHCL